MLAAHLALTLTGPEQEAALRQAASDLQTHLSDQPTTAPPGAP